MKYVSHQLTFQEVPDEISLSFLISGCRVGCRGCHSVFAWDENVGTLLSVEALRALLKKYAGLVTCVCFLGGEWHPQELVSLCRLIQKEGLKTCLYTGLEDISPEIKAVLDFVKLGPYVKEKGGLASRSTNQRMINLKTNELLNERFLNKEC